MITPSDSPSDAAGYASVAVQQADILAPSPADEVSAAFAQSVADAGAGVLYPRSERQEQARQMMESPAGYGEQDIDGGSSFGWPNNVEPADNDAS